MMLVKENVKFHNKFYPETQFIEKFLFLTLEIKIKYDKSMKGMYLV